LKVKWKWTKNELKLNKKLIKIELKLNKELGISSLWKFRRSDMDLFNPCGDQTTHFVG
jgi:hypothetical protein